MGLHPYRMHSNGSPTDHDELVRLTSMNNLALVLSSQGKYEQAEEMHRQELNWFAYYYRMINTTSFAQLQKLKRVLRLDFSTTVIGLSLEKY
jgi:hypothetical protein